MCPSTRLSRRFVHSGRQGNAGFAMTEVETRYIRIPKPEKMIIRKARSSMRTKRPRLEMGTQRGARARRHLKPPVRCLRDVTFTPKDIRSRIPTKTA